MALGNQLENGNWADLTAAAKTNIMAIKTPVEE
jgi:hypothetical protein